jgi:uncharacterized protein
MAYNVSSSVGIAIKPHKWRKIGYYGMATALCILLLLIVTISISNIRDFDPPDVTRHEISFPHGGHTLQGTLYEVSKNSPIAFLVHGDGAQDRTSDSGYLPLIHALTDAGISVFSWDKPGVAASTGNWLNQSMQDRATETVAALTALRALPGMDRRALGLIGFSQAGWVLPKVPRITDDISFLVLIGAAVSWKEQSDFYTTRRLESEGQCAQTIADYVQSQHESNTICLAPSANYADYVAHERKARTVDSARMSEERFGFVKRNCNEDVRLLLPGLTIPVLVLSGAEDRNVDGSQTVSVYNTALAGANPHNRFELVPRATHSLLDSRHYNYQLPTQWSVSAKTRFLLSGRAAYAPQVLYTLTNWITTVSETSAGR